MSKWEKVVLSDVATLLNGRAYKQDELLREGKTPVLRVGNLFSNKEWYYSDLDLEENKYCDNGDLLFAWSASFGPKIWTGGKVIYHYHIWKISLSDKLDRNYMYYFLLNSAEKIKAQGHGITMIHTTKGEMEKMLVPLPPLDVQKHIADTLDKAQEIIDGHKKQLEELDNLIKATFYDMFGDPVTNEKSWERVLLKDILLSIRYGTSTPPVFSETGYKFIRATNIKNGRIIENDMKFISEDEADKIEKCKMLGYEMIIVRSGVNSGDTCVITEEYIGHYAGYDLILEYNQERVSPFFVNELFNTSYMEKVIKPLTRRAAQPHLNSDQVQSLQIILPPLELQKKYVKIVTNIEEQKSIVKQSITESQNLFNSLMSQYFD